MLGFVLTKGDCRPYDQDGQFFSTFSVTDDTVWALAVAMSPAGRCVQPARAVLKVDMSEGSPDEVAVTVSCTQRGTGRPSMSVFEDAAGISKLVFEVSTDFITTLILKKTASYRVEANAPAVVSQGRDIACSASIRFSQVSVLV